MRKLILLFFYFTPFLGYAQYKYPHGDTNNDGIVNAADIVEIVNIIMGENVEKKIITADRTDTNVKRIYGDGSTYCAFTSLIKRAGIYYLAFREAATHVSEGDYGVIKILKSNDGENWDVLQTLSQKEKDLRDPNLSLMPNGKLLLICGVSFLSDNGMYETRTMYTKETEQGIFDDLKSVRLPMQVNWNTCTWVWRLSWHEDKGYGMCYGDGHIALLVTKDGVNFDLIKEFVIPKNPTEACIQFKSDGTAVTLIRRDGTGYMGVSLYPYYDWNWKELDIYLAGHTFVFNDNSILVATRMTQNVGDRTVLWKGNIEGNFDFCYVLPFGGISGNSDTAYAGIVLEEDRLLISYYAIGEGEKPSIYLAKLSM